MIESNLTVVVNELTNKENSATITNMESHLWKKNLASESQNDLYRVMAILPSSNFKHPLSPFIQFAISNGRDSVVFHLPEITNNGTPMFETSRFLLPLHSTEARQNYAQSLVVSVHSRWPEEVTYTLVVKALSEGQYIVRPNKSGVWSQTNEKAGLGRPEAHFWKTTGIERAQLTIRSDDNICSVLYMNNREESIYYKTGELNSDTNAGFRAISFSKRLDLKLEREYLGEMLYLYVLVQPDDSLCDPNAPSRNLNKKKTYNITLNIMTEESYWLPMGLYIGIFLAVPVLLLGYALSQLPRRGATPVENPQQLIQIEDEENVGRVSLELTQLNPTRMTNVPLSRDNVLLASIHEGLRPYDNEGTIIEEGNPWSVGDLHFVFFMIPGLILSAQQYAQSLPTHRLEDNCFHNYGCAKPWGRLVAFNHLISNVGYIINGGYYIAFVCIRHQKHSNGRGIHSNYGLELALGSALICQGIGSSIYHICPSRLSFSFDTPFMQTTAVLAMLKLYGNRHGYIAPSTATLFLAAALATNTFFLMLDDRLIIRSFQALIQIMALGVILIKISKGREVIPKDLVVHPTKCLPHILSLRTSLFAVVAVVLNLLIAVGHFFNIGLCQSNQVVTLICIGNMILYLVYYYSRKVRSKEKLNGLSNVAAVISIVLWFAAGLFFFREESDWKLTPAQSRNLNSDCYFLSFFDQHDIWHLMSAQAVFLSLIALSTVDDAQSALPRHELEIF